MVSPKLLTRPLKYPPVARNGRQVMPVGGGDCKSISKQTVVPSTDASKQNTGESAWVGDATTARHPVHRLWGENITECTQVTDLK